MTRSALLLDLDEVLVDVPAHTDYAAALDDLRDLLRDWRDVPLPGPDGIAAAQACLAVLDRLAGDPRWTAVSAVLAAYETAAVAHSDALPGVPEAQRLWRDRPVGAITVLPAEIARAALARYGVRVDLVVGREPGLRPKPAGDGLLAACRRLGVDPARAVVVGESTWDLAAAADAGTGFVGIPHTPGALPPGTPLAADLAAAVRWVLAA